MALTIPKQSGKGGKSGKAKAKDHADPKAEKASEAPSPAAWDKIALPEALKGAASEYAKTRTQSFGAYVGLATQLTFARQALTSAQGGVLPPKHARAFFAYKLGPMIAGAEDPAYAGLDFRRAKPTDSPETKKLLQRWQAFVTQVDQAGLMIQRLADQGISAAADYPSMSASKLRVLFPAWQRAAREKDVSLSKQADAPAATKLLKALYAKALKTTRDEIVRWFRPQDTGEDSADSVSAQEGAADAEAAKGGKAVTFDSATKVCVNGKAGRYTYDEVVRIRDTFIKIAETMKKKAVGEDAEDTEEEEIDLD